MNETTKGCRVSDERLAEMLERIERQRNAGLYPSWTDDVVLDLRDERAAHAETRKAYADALDIIGRGMSTQREAVRQYEAAIARENEAIAERDALKSALAALVGALRYVPTGEGTRLDVLEVYDTHPALTAAREVIK